MKSSLLLFAATLFCTCIFAQSGSIGFSGTVRYNTEDSVIHLRNLDGVDISIPINAQKSFSFVGDSLQKGFYEVGGLGTIYLCPGYQLTVKHGKVGTYLLQGNGAMENNLLRDAKKQIAEFFTLSKSGELTQDIYYMDVPVFLQKLDSFQKKGEMLFNKSSDPFFRKYASLDLEFYGKSLLHSYSIYYGKDLQKMRTNADLAAKLDRKSPDFLKNITSLMKSAQVKEMAGAERLKMTKLVYTDWDRNNDTLFRNSIAYRNAFQNYLTLMKSNMKYLFPVPKVWRVVDADIIKLKAAKGEISNPYILAYFKYAITSSILKQTKDTVVLNKYYNEFLASSPRKDHLEAIAKIYINNILYSDSSAAPSFSYSDVSGKTVSLESLRGKFIYIDIWATWCGPCKAEIPHLKKLESEYGDKNIEFVSISVDEQVNLNKWKLFVKKNDLKGIQLITNQGFEAAFISKMGINSIPRFILIDPEGKIISADALRPSDKELRILLDKFL